MATAAPACASEAPAAAPSAASAKAARPAEARRRGRSRALRSRQHRTGHDRLSRLEVARDELGEAAVRDPGPDEDRLDLVGAGIFKNVDPADGRSLTRSRAARARET